MTSVKNIASCQERHFETIYNHVNRSVVFIDTVSAELLHWQGGLLKLINAGATSLKEFSSFESGSKDQKKGVFIINSLLEGVTREILKDIIQASSFQYVVVFTSQSAALHVYSRSGVVEEDSDFFDQVEERLLEWMGNMNFTAEVFHVPLSSINLGNSLFLTPGYSRLFPLIGSDLHHIELQYNSKHEKNEMRDFGTLKDVDFLSLPKELQMFYKSFISSLDTLLSDLGVKEDIFSMGYTSAILASELEAYPPAKTRRKTLSGRASVVFIDRTLDLASVTSYNTESLLDKIQQVLPRLPGHVTDVSVDMSSLCKVHREHGAETISSGCLATQTVSQSHLQTLITGRNKEALMEVNRQLIEAASSSNLPVSLTGKPTRVSAEQLNATLSVFRGKYKEISKHLDWLQVSMATYQTLSNPIMHHCDEMISVEKGLLQSLVEPDGPGALSQVLQMIQKKKEKEDTWMYSLDDILCILVFVYSLGGSTLLSQMDEEAALQDSKYRIYNFQEMILDRVIQEKSQLPPLMRSIVGEIVTDRSIVSDILEDLWEKLSSISVSREHLSQFKSVLDPGSAISPASQNPLLKQLVEAMLDPDKPEIVDLEFKSSGLRDKLKSGFGLFRGVSKPRPSDHPLMILFIVGGVNCTEVKQIKDVFNQYKPGCQIMGCFYHLTQATWRRVQAEGLQSDYNNDDDVKSFCEKLDGLAFLPCSDVQEGLTLLRELAPDHLQCLVEYFDSNYVNGSFRAVITANGNMRFRRSSPRFPPPIWNVHSATMTDQDRTNNQCESWNNGFKHLVGHSNPSLWTVVQCVEKDAKMVAAEILRCNRGELLQKRVKKATKAHQQRLKVLCSQYASGIKSLEDFLGALGQIIRIK